MNTPAARLLSRSTLLLVLLALAGSTAANAEEQKAWYQRIDFRGYTQVRFNRVMESNPNLTCEQCDRSLGGNHSFFIRRSRLVFSGDLNDRLSFYIQPDLAASAGDSGENFLQLRDAYFDVHLDSRKTWRLRVGQSKIPYGFENMQSSSHRAALDRSDAINSAFTNERDLGVFLYWAPEAQRQRFAELANADLKGSGDYGVFAFGLFNGQTSNRGEQNRNLHAVARISYPLLVGEKQILEPSIQAYSGLYTLTEAQRSAGTLGESTHRDERVAASLIYYPQPFGLQLEANTGRGPAYQPETNRVESRRLVGGYVQAMALIEKGDTHKFLPYVRTQYYQGGKKTELDARYYLVREHEIGVEWRPMPALELTTSFTRSDRKTGDAARPSADEAGNRIRIQAQFNY